MEFKVTPKVARTLATRLQNASSPKMARAEALEKISKIFGFANWDAFNGVLLQTQPEKSDAAALYSKEFLGKAKRFRWEEKPPVLKEAFTLCWEAFAVDSSGGPAWAMLTIDQSFLDTVQAAQTKVIRANLGAICQNCAVTAWDESDRNRMRGEGLHVSEDSLWISSYSKASGIATETRSLYLAELFGVIKDRTKNTDPCLSWAGDYLVYSGSGAKDLAKSLLEDELIAVTDEQVEAMPNNSFWM